MCVQVQVFVLVEPFWGPSRARSWMWCEARMPCTNQVRHFQFPPTPCPVRNQSIGACVEIPPWKADQALGWCWTLKFRVFLCPRILAVMGSVRCTDISISPRSPFVLSVQTEFQACISHLLGMQERGDQNKYLVVVWGLSSCSPVGLFIGFFISLGFFFFICILQTWIITVNCVSLLNDTFIFNFQCVWHCIQALQREVAELNNSFPS